MGDGNKIIIIYGGSDMINIGVGNDYIDSGDGDDVIDVGFGNNIVFVGVGNDMVKMVGGNDYIDLGLGNDVIDVGGGLDMVFGGFGNDIIFYCIGENVGGKDYYDGGLGIDMLCFELMQVEWQSVVVCSDVKNFFVYLFFLINKLFVVCGLVMVFKFSLINLMVVNVENFEVFVGGQKFDLINMIIKVIGDVIVMSEDVVSVIVDFFVNDVVLQWVFLVKLFMILQFGVV